ncbi:MAG TPA: histidine kinase [Steroidobacteraceae bacterium]|nr:histidine kinase [Steroidobacteraceae bacterium]
MSATQSVPPSIRWRWIAALWCAGGLFEATQAVLIMRFGEGRDGAWLPLFATSLATWLPWALATPWIIGLARRYPIIRGTTLRTVAVHVAAFAAISALAEAWSALLQVLFNPWGNRLPPTFWNTWRITLLYQVVMFLIAYALILVITYLVDSRDRVARQMTETARLNEELSKSQLAALRRQMEPHFMFNTLNSIAGLVRDHRNDAAVSMIVGLSEFLRRASEDSHRSQVTLAEEVEYLQRYVDIQQIRFGERLRVSVDIPADLLEARVPGLLLQPLVENAIKHGIATRVVGGNIRVSGARRGSGICLRVYNDGPAFAEDRQTDGAGVGLANLRTRLQILHGDAAELQMKRAGTDGVEVVVTLPLQEA